MMNISSTALYRTLFVGGVIIAVSAGLLVAGERIGFEGTDVARERKLQQKIDRLRTTQDSDARRALRADIASMEPVGATLALLEERYSSSDAFLRNQIESIVGQMNFAADTQDAFAIAASTKEYDLFVAISFGLGHSASAAARQSTLALVESNAFGSDSNRAKGAVDTIAWVLVDELTVSDFVWLEAALAKGELSRNQTAIALQAAERMPSHEVLRFLERAASIAEDGDARASLQEKARTVRNAIRPNRQ